MASVYIIYSTSKDCFYTGFTTENVNVRIDRHNSDYYDNKFTADGVPWDLYLEIQCKSAEQARGVEENLSHGSFRNYIVQCTQIENGSRCSNNS